VVLVDHNRVVYLKAFGIESIFGHSPFTVDSACPVGSLTKSFTALAAMQLARRGALDLDAPVVKYLPWFRTSDRERSDRITVRMLLNQTSGLPSLDQWAFEEGSVEQVMEQAVRMFRARKTSREPGQAFESSDDDYTVAGLIIHQLSGKSYCDYLQSALLDPLKISLRGRRRTIRWDIGMQRARPGPVPDRNGQSRQGGRRRSHRTGRCGRNDDSGNRLSLSDQFRRRRRSQHLALWLGMDDRGDRRTSPGASRGGHRASGIDCHDRSRAILGRLHRPE
jgi:CubicO group peptidase (beta-lactamase class C family)